ncbi:MAG: tyrosine-type recombinase/integrase [Christensenellales bacterium]|jgi:integrase
MAKKRPDNEGSIRQRPDGRWEARYRDAHGNRKSVYALTQSEVSAKLRDILQQISKDEYCEPSRLTVGEWMQTWWNEYCVPTTRKNSASVTRQGITSHIMPALGKIRLQRLRSDQIQGLVNKLTQSGYAPATVRRVIASLRTAMRQAVANNLILRNPVDGVRLPKMEQKEIAVLSTNEQRLLLEALPGTDNGRALRFILGTGLRSSEALGLRWSDIKGDAFTVNQAITDYRDYESTSGPRIKREVAPPKSSAGKRTIPLTASMQELLAEQWREQLKQKEAALAKGVGWPKDGLVFTNQIGEPKDKSNLSRTLRQALAKAGLPHRGVHALRHTFATNAVQSGMDIRTLSEIIGHTKIAFTLQTYAHSDMDTKRKALEMMEAAM